MQSSYPLHQVHYFAVDLSLQKKERALKRQQNKDELLAFATYQPRSLRERRRVSYTYSKEICIDHSRRQKRPPTLFQLLLSCQNLWGIQFSG